MFKKRENVVEIEEGNLLSPKFDNDGLIPVITMCSKTKEILQILFFRKMFALWHSLSNGKSKVGCEALFSS